ncbi:MAG: hypothetical protein AABY83_01675 [Pseudomonadota bacterium]
MSFYFRAISWRFLGLNALIAVLISGCGLGSPPTSGRIAADEDPSSLTARVRIAGAWSVPTKLASESASNESSDMLRGPQLVGDGQGNAFVSWRLLTDLDIQTGLYTDGHNAAYKYIAPQPWAVTQPSDNGANLADASMFEFAVNRYRGNVYATWRQGADIMVNRYESGAGWDAAATNIGAGNWAAPVNSSDDSTALVVGSVDSANGSTTLNIARFNGTEWAVEDKSLVRSAVDINLARPVMFQSVTDTGTPPVTTPGTVAVAWTETSAAGVLGLWAAAYTASGWSTPVTIGTAGGAVNTLANPQLLVDNTSGRAQLVYFAGESANAGALHIATYDATNGWMGARPFDTAQRASRKAGSDFSVSFDDMGNAVAAWREESVVGTLAVNGIYARTYSPSKGWNQVRRVSALGRLVDGANGAIASVVHTPHVKLNASKVIALTWAEDTSLTSEVLVAYTDFAANPVWPAAADLVAFYNTRGVKVEQPQIALNDSNGLVVVWRQATSSATKTDYAIWSSTKGTQQGQAVDVVVGSSPPPPPASPIPPGHAGFIDNCVSCHNGAAARGKPLTHINTQDTCAACHAVVKWKPAVKVDHAAVNGTCVSCHNNVAARGKPLTHIAAADKCSACHSAEVWKPVVFVDHAEVLGDCVTCHTDAAATVVRGKPATHILASDMCNACHTAPVGANKLPTWLPIAIDHAQVLGTCVSCHSGALGAIKGKPATHVPASDGCDKCHRVTAFAPILGFDHTQTTAGCADCHGGAYAGISSKGPNHAATTAACDTCHSTVAWRPAVNGGNSGGGSPGGGGVINGTWGVPVNVVTINAPSNTLTLVHGPELAWSENGSGFLSLRKNTGFNYATGKFTNGEDIVQRYDAAAVSWASKNPVPAAQSKTSDIAQVKTFGANGEAYAIWLYGADVYFNKFNGTAWGTPEKSGATGPDSYQLLVSTAGHAVVYWATGNDLHVRRYIPASGTVAASWMAEQTLSVTDGFAMEPAVAMDADGNLTVAWLHMSGVLPQGEWKTHASINNGVDSVWSAIQSGPTVYTGATPLALNVAVHGEPGLPLMVLHTDGGGLAQGGALAASEYIDGSWSAWVNIDYNVLMKDQIVGVPAVAYNRTGDVLVVWTEKEVMNGNTAYHVFSNFYASGALTWGEPMHVSMSSAEASMSAVDETEPSIMLDDAGHVTAVWLATDGITSRVLSNHYHKTGPDIGWNQSPELIVSYTIDTDGYALNPRVGVGAGSKATAVWKQVVRQQFSMDYKVWSSSVP